VGVLVGVTVGLAVTEAVGVLLGIGVLLGLGVKLGRIIVVLSGLLVRAPVGLGKTVTVNFITSSLTGLHPTAARDRINGRVNTARVLIVFFCLPINRYIVEIRSGFPL
jgi:hypothetical protein